MLNHNVKLRSCWREQGSTHLLAAHFVFTPQATGVKGT
jgi:hypothetical protein